MPRSRQIRVNLPAITKKDRADIEFGLEQQVVGEIAFQHPWDDKSVAQGKAEICHHLDVIENQLTSVHGPWLVDTFSLAVIGYAPFVLVLDRVELGDEVSKRPHVSAWVKQLLERPSIIATAMPDS